MKFISSLSTFCFCTILLWCFIEINAKGGRGGRGGGTGSSGSSSSGGYGSIGSGSYESNSNGGYRSISSGGVYGLIGSGGHIQSSSYDHGSSSSGSYGSRNKVSLKSSHSHGSIGPDSLGSRRTVEAYIPSSTHYNQGQRYGYSNIDLDSDIDYLAELEEGTTEIERKSLEQKYKRKIFRIGNCQNSDGNLHDCTILNRPEADQHVPVADQNVPVTDQRVPIANLFLSNTPPPKPLPFWSVLIDPIDDYKSETLAPRKPPTISSQIKEEGPENLFVKDSLKISTVAPKIITPIREMNVQEGMTLVKDIQFVGEPIPKVEWLLDGAPIVSNDRVTISNYDYHTILYITDVKESDRGNYTLTVKNLHGNDSGILNVNVLVAPKIITPMHEMKVLEGMTLTADIKFTGKPVPEVEWSLDGMPIVNTGRVTTSSFYDHSILNITDLKISDSGNYTLTVRNIHGNDSGILDVKVLVAPKITTPKRFHEMNLREGMTLTTEIKFFGEPAPEVEWLLDGEPIVNNDRVTISNFDDHTVLNIVDVKLSDSGKYTLTVKNPAGKDSGTLDVKVLAVCHQSCLNGGSCIAFNVCGCPAEYRGPRCEYHFMKCDIKKLAGDMKIQWVCNHSKKGTSCKIKCPHQIEFDPEEYKCSPDGTWTPSEVPRCLDTSKIVKQ